MNLTRLVLIAAWVALTYITIVVTQAHGVAAATTVFADDVAAMNWRAQFNIDLLCHILLVGIWIAWRSKFSVAGIITALFCLCGGLFTLPYVVALTLYHKGDLKKVALGNQAAA